MRNFNPIFTLAVAIFLGFSSLAWASSAGFVIRVEGADLGKPSEGEVPQYRVRVEQGQSIVLVAVGRVYGRPRGPNDLAALQGSPGQPEAGAWLFDDEAWVLQVADKKKYDDTMIPIRLKAEKAGTTRIRFVGNILGYDRKFDILVEVAAPKK